jgi:hypothetical protein
LWLDKENGRATPAKARRPREGRGGQKTEGFMTRDGKAFGGTAG